VLLYREEEKIYAERLELAEGRILELLEELSGEAEERNEKAGAAAADCRKALRRYFGSQFSFCNVCCKLNKYIRSDDAASDSLEEMRKLNRGLYEEMLPENYAAGWLNPAVCQEKLGEYGQLLCVLAAEMRAQIAACYERRAQELVIRQELLLEVYGAFERAFEEGAEGPKAEEIREILYWYVSDYSEVVMDRRVRSQVDPAEDFCTKIVMEADLSDNRFLYAYGEYVTEQEEKMADYLRGLPEEKIRLIADTYTEGYRMGFVLGRKDLSKKKTVNIRYHLGFERIIRAAVKNFEKMGLKPVIYRQAVSILEGKGIHRIGVYGAAPNKQFDYDHKEDIGLVLDKKLVNRKLELLKSSFEEHKEWAFVHAGPAVMEIFGEADFTPENKECAVKLTEKQQKLSVEYASGAGQITNEYIKGEERSFTIIAFPVPDIGERFEEIFDETIRLNTLDYNLYRDIQQRIIDALDEAEYCIIKGMGKNRTNMKVMLHKLTDRGSQTNFENCVADVNIPVGEVFTSPLLAGTEGTLHVTKVFLNELQYENLELTFRDGMVTDYTCTNFESESENKKLVRDTVLFHHDSLPLGEFAIGTNTTAYVAAKRLRIEDKLPILIAEKMGPHFAVGDTCYSHAEDVAVFNPDGKEIIARDNEKSLVRKEHPEQAYFNCHTDITIPYDELGEVSAVRADGSVEMIIEEGRFVLPGCEALNEPLLSGR
jgi:aminopeptidase